MPYWDDLIELHNDSDDFDTFSMASASLEATELGFLWEDCDKCSVTSDNTLVSLDFKALVEKLKPYST
jgi:hypothetical protein